MQLSLPLEHDDAPKMGEVLPRLQNLLLDIARHAVDINAALCYGRDGRTIDTIVLGVLEGRLHFYPLRRSFIIMCVREIENGRAYMTDLAGGDLDELREYMPTIERRAAELGCRIVGIEGRRGWERAMKPAGYEFAAVTLVKEL